MRDLCFGMPGADHRLDHREVVTPLVLIAVSAIREGAGDGFHELSAAERLQHVADRSRGDGTLHEVALAVSCQRDDGHIALVELASADERKLPDAEFARLYRAMG